MQYKEKKHITDKDWETVAEVFKNMGFSVLVKPEIEDNNPDMVIVGIKRAYNVEIKHARLRDNGIIEADFISENQIRESDIVAVVMPSGYVFIERTDDYVKHISEKGHRYFTYLNPKGSKSIK